jgi:hypothetical protein
MQPLRIKASSTPPSSANFQGLQEMSDAEINQYLSYVITNKFATDTDGTGTAELNVDTANALTGTSIGTWTNTIRNDAIGTHPSTGSTTNTTYYFKQVTAAASESITNRPVGYDSAIKEFNDASLDTDVLDKVIEDMVTSTGYTVGQYSLAASAPAGGTWTSRASITDSNRGGSTTLYLWQKTAPSVAANSDLASLKLDGTNVKAMSATEIEQMVPSFRNRIIDSGVGTYKIQTSTPAEAGTWVQMGDTLTDTRQQIASQNYAGNYTGSFSGSYADNYAGNYVGAKTYTGAYAGSYVGNYAGNYVGAKTYSGSYAGSYVGNYAGNYVGAKTYSGSYTGSFSGTYAGNYVGTSAYTGAYAGAYATTNAYTLFYAGFAGGTNYYTGYFTGFYTGFYTGAKTYTGYYTGAYNRNFSGNYVGTSAYSGVYAGTYTGYYSGNYVGTSAYTGNYAGTYTGSYSGNYVGTSAYSGVYSGAYAGTYSRNFSGTYAGNTIQATTENVSTVKLWLKSA